MNFLYDLALLLLRTGVAIASVFKPKARAFVSGRRNVFASLESFQNNLKGKVVWVHCASLGEFEQGRPVIEALKKEFPTCKILLTFFSPSGYEVRKNYEGADLVTYLPWDTRSNAEKFVRSVNPDLAIFVKYEFWYHYLATLKSAGIPVISISSIFRPNQIFFKSYGGFYRDILKNVTFFFVQNKRSMELLQSIGISNGSIAGDTRLDRVNQIVKDAAELPAVRRFKANQKVFVIGSSWPEDFAVLKELIKKTPHLKFVIAPHEISDSNIKSIEQELDGTSVRYSEVDRVNSGDKKVLIIDNMGMLSRIYRYGEFAYVGGAFGKGLHNILEAACYGMPVLFGNKSYQRFQEAVDLISRGGAFVVNDAQHLKDTFKNLEDPLNYERASLETRRYVSDNLGATEKIIIYCRTKLS